MRHPGTPELENEAPRDEFKNGCGRAVPPLRMFWVFVTCPCLFDGKGCSRLLRYSLFLHPLNRRGGGYEGGDREGIVLVE